MKEIVSLCCCLLFAVKRTLFDYMHHIIQARSTIASTIQTDGSPLHVSGKWKPISVKLFYLPGYFREKECCCVTAVSHSSSVLVARHARRN